MAFHEATELRHRSINPPQPPVFDREDPLLLALRKLDVIVRRGLKYAQLAILAHHSFLHVVRPRASILSIRLVMGWNPFSRTDMQSQSRSENLCPVFRRLGCSANHKSMLSTKKLLKRQKTISPSLPPEQFTPPARPVHWQYRAGAALLIAIAYPVAIGVETGGFHRSGLGRDLPCHSSRIPVMSSKTLKQRIR